MRWQLVDSAEAAGSRYELTGMAFDDGMGVDSIWLQDAGGNRWLGDFIYASHFKVVISDATQAVINSAVINSAVQGPLTLHITDKAGNEQRLKVSLPK